LITSATVGPAAREPAAARSAAFRSVSSRAIAVATPALSFFGTGRPSSSTSMTARALPVVGFAAPSRA